MVKALCPMLMVTELVTSTKVNGLTTFFVVKALTPTLMVDSTTARMPNAEGVPHGHGTETFDNGIWAGHRYTGLYKMVCHMVRETIAGEAGAMLM